jgi:hypothetical protein
VAVEVDIANVALLRIGQLQTIAELDEPTPHAQAINAVFAHLRDAVLEAFAWPFAMKRATLDVLASAEDDPDDPLLRSGWGFTYQLPADCIAPRYIYPGTNTPGEGQEVPFVIEADETVGTAGRVLLTNEGEAELIYTAKITQPNRWSPTFRDAMAFRLASDLAMSVAKRPELGLRLYQLYQAKLSEAAAQVSNQAKEDSPPPDASFIRERG